MSLLAAAASGSTSECRLLLEAGGDVGERDEDGYTPLLSAVQKGHTEVCELLLEVGGDVEERSPVTLWTSLHYAAINGNERIVKLLLSHKADVNSRGKLEATPLHLASQEGHLASVVAFLKAGADPLLPQYDGALPIHLAAKKNHTEVVRILIESTKCSPDQVGHISQSIDHRSNAAYELIITIHSSSSSLFPLAARHKG